MTWQQFYQKILDVIEKILGSSQRSRPVPVYCDWGIPTADEEKWADDWLRKFCLEQKIGRLTQRQRYILAPRFRYATMPISFHAKLIGDEYVPDPWLKLEVLLIQEWHEKNKKMWLNISELMRPDQKSFS